MSEEYEITGGLDLLGDWLDAKGYTEEAGLCTRAMYLIHKQSDKITKLQDGVRLTIQERDIFSGENWDLRAENKKLRSALKPFAAILKEHGGFEKMPIDITILINAAEALIENNRD